MEYCNEGGLFCKAKSVVSSLYGIILWTSTLPSLPMHNLPKHHQYPTLPGLKTLIYTSSLQAPENPSFPSLLIHSYMIRLSHSQAKPSPPSSSSLFHSLTEFSLEPCNSVFDDLIGTENGVYMNSDEGQELSVRFFKKSEANNICVENKQNQCAVSEKKTYPPPIPLLARTCNLPGHMPWILTRHYTNGKLVLREERVKHHEYFEAHRENGRLVLNLVSLDDEVRCNHSDCNNNQEELELQDFNDYFSQEEEEMIEDTEDEEDEEDEEIETLLTPLSTACSVPKSNKLKLMKEVEGSGDLRKCFTYSGKMSSEFKYLSCNARRSGNAFNTICQSGSAPLAFNNSTATHQITAGVA